MRSYALLGLLFFVLFHVVAAEILANSSQPADDEQVNVVYTTIDFSKFEETWSKNDQSSNWIQPLDSIDSIKEFLASNTNKLVYVYSHKCTPCTVFVELVKDFGYLLAEKNLKIHKLDIKLLTKDAKMAEFLGLRRFPMIFALSSNPVEVGAKEADKKEWFVNSSAPEQSLLAFINQQTGIDFVVEDFQLLREARLSGKPLSPLSANSEILDNKEII